MTVVLLLKPEVATLPEPFCKRNGQVTSGSDVFPAEAQSDTVGSENRNELNNFIAHPVKPRPPLHHPSV